MSITSMCFIIALGGGGCVSLEKESDNAESNEQIEIAVYEGVMPNELPECINAELKIGVTLDGYLDVSEELTEYKLKRTVLTRHVLESKWVVENFLKTQDNLGVKEKKSSKKQDELLENGKFMEVYTVELDGGWIQCRDLYFLFRYNDISLFDTYYRNESSDGSYLDIVPRGKELGFISIEEAKKKFQNSLSFLELKNMLEPEVFTFTADFIQKVQNEECEKAKELGREEYIKRYDIDSSVEDGYYYIRMKQGVQGVPIYCLQGIDETISGTYYNLPTSAECIYGKTGIVNLNITNLYDIKEEEEVEIKSFCDILKKFCSNHGTVETTIKYIGLSYLPIVKDNNKLEFNGQPVWYFVYDEMLGGLTTRKITIYNAETGEIIK